MLSKLLKKENMKIGKIIINNSQVSYADKIVNVLYNDSIDIDIEMFNQLKAHFLAMNNEKLLLVKKQISEIEEAEFEVLQDSKKIDLKNFIFDTGISIANNLSSSIIFEATKYLLF